MKEGRGLLLPKLHHFLFLGTAKAFCPGKQPYSFGQVCFSLGIVPVYHVNTLAGRQFQPAHIAKMFQYNALNIQTAAPFLP